MRVRTRCECSLSSLINIIRMQLLLVDASRMSDFLGFFSSHRFFLFILYCVYIYIYMYVHIESTIDDDCKRLRDAADLIEERGTMPCVCEEDAIIIIVLVERTREISLISSFFFFIFRLFMGFRMHERMYTINKVPCMFPRCMCA